MTAKTTIHGLRALGLGVIAGLFLCASTGAVAAEHAGGGGGGAHFGGGYGGPRVGGFHGGYYGGYRGGWGWRGGYGWGWGGCCWGWPFLAALPLYYSTWWWGGVPYYYAYDNYYVWNGTGYAVVTPPTEVLSQGAPPPGGVPPAGPGAPGGAGGSELFAYPKNGQSLEQQQRDKDECRVWAASQGGAPAAGGAGATPLAYADSLRAQTACLEARGYSVK
jgi:hypothetical protein